MLSRRYYFPIVIDNQWIKGGLTYNMDRGRGRLDDKRNLYFLSCLSIVVRLWNTSKIFHTVVIFAVTNMHCLRLSGAKVCLLHVTHPFITICDSEYMYFQKKNWSNTCMCCFDFSSCIEVSTFAKKSRVVHFWQKKVELSTFATKKVELSTFEEEKKLSTIAKK